MKSNWAKEQMRKWENEQMRKWENVLKLRIKHPCDILLTPFVVPFVVFAFVVPQKIFLLQSTLYIYSNSISNITYSITSRYLELCLVELLKLRLNLNWGGGVITGGTWRVILKMVYLFLYIYSYIYFYS